ncbi:MAG TPA: ATP-binding cassette domain-containing protein, partial [Xanthobacteraceae bacterium]|nr:ATP-binding cassette domain-containing protein [Xanthobacteraceae bacterium]
MQQKYTPLLIALATLVLLPFVLPAVGLTLTTATDVVIFAIACMGLNILVGHTGLVSFGHGAFFGLAGYAAALSQRHWFPGDIVIPSLFALVFVALFAWLAGFLILRRRGVYFSLLTLALSAMLFTIAFRWTAVTGGESGLGGVVRPAVLGVDLGRPWTYYGLVALIGFAVTVLLWRFHRSPVGHVLVAIRENEQRARFIGYPADRYKLFAFTMSATITGLAGVLSVFHHRFASAEPISVAFSGELLAMVVIGGMRSFLGPALGALFFILFREFLSIWTENWLLYFGLLFVGFIVFSPTGLVGVAEQLLKPFRKRVDEAAAMSAREVSADAPLPDALANRKGSDGPVLIARELAKSFGGIRAVAGADIVVENRSLHALIGPNGAGKTTAFNLVSGMFPPDAGFVTVANQSVTGFRPEDITRAGVGRSFQITNL